MAGYKQPQSTYDRHDPAGTYGDIDADVSFVLDTRFCGKQARFGKLVV
jgi:hypothetical protein